MATRKRIDEHVEKLGFNEEFELRWWREVHEFDESDGPLPIVFYEAFHHEEPMFECTVKWDGCNDWHLPDGNLHTCGPIIWLKLVARVFQIALTELDGDIQDGVLSTACGAVLDDARVPWFWPNLQERLREAYGPTTTSVKLDEYDGKYVAAEIHRDDGIWRWSGSVVGIGDEIPRSTQASLAFALREFRAAHGDDALVFASPDGRHVTAAQMEELIQGPRNEIAETYAAEVMAAAVKVVAERCAP